MKSISYFLLLFFAICPVEAITITGTFDENKGEELKGMNPPVFDLLLLDLPLAKMKMKTKAAFGFIYNSKFTENAVFPIDGVILKETYERVIIPITVMHKKRKIRTTCVVDCGSPWTFMSENTLADLGIEVLSDDFNLVVHGTPVTVYRSVNHFNDINICGQSFFSEHKAELMINYRTRKVTVKKTNELTEQELEEL